MNIWKFLVWLAITLFLLNLVGCSPQEVGTATGSMIMSIAEFVKAVGETVSELNGNTPDTSTPTPTPTPETNITYET